MRRSTVLACVAALMACVPALVKAQALSEYGATAAHSASGAAGAGKAGKSAATVLGNVSKTLGAAAGQQGTTATGAASKTATAPAGTAKPVETASAKAPANETPAKPVDLNAIVSGMDRKEMIEKAGKPAMSITGVEAGVLVETCTYRSGSDSLTVTLRDNKVAEIKRLN